MIALFPVFDLPGMTNKVPALSACQKAFFGKNLF
jgi:hypothetical protein